MKFLFIAIVMLFAVSAFAGLDRPIQVTSTEVISPTASSTPNVPGDADYVIMTVRTAGVHINFFGLAATTSDVYFPTGVYVWSNQRDAVKAFRLINSSDGSASVGMVYCKGR